MELDIGKDFLEFLKLLSDLYPNLASQIRGERRPRLY